MERLSKLKLTLMIIDKKNPVKLTGFFYFVLLFGKSSGFGKSVATLSK
jgi:hypothetical protein